MKWFLFLFLWSELCFAKPLFLLGLIEAGGGKGVAVFGSDQVIQVGETIRGYKLESVGYRGVFLSRGAQRFWLKTGEAVDETMPLVITDGIEHKDGIITVSTMLRDYVAKEGLLTIMMQAASMPEKDGDGNTIGYRLLEIDAGSIYELAGMQNHDVLLEIDEVPIRDPLTALRMLNAIKDKDQFTFKYRRAGEDLKTKVVVK